MDGKTQITLGFESEVGPGNRPIFDSVLKTPTGMVVISTVDREEVLGAPVPSHETRIRIWANRADEPDQIVIVAGGQVQT